MFNVHDSWAYKTVWWNQIAICLSETVKVLTLLWILWVSAFENICVVWCGTAYIVLHTYCHIWFYKCNDRKIGSIWCEQGALNIFNEIRFIFGCIYFKEALFGNVTFIRYIIVIIIIDIFDPFTIAFAYIPSW